jgi:hypothetical protein
MIQRKEKEMPETFYEVYDEIRSIQSNAHDRINDLIFDFVELEIANLRRDLAKHSGWIDEDHSDDAEDYIQPLPESVLWEATKQITRMIDREAEETIKSNEWRKSVDPRED